GVVGHARDDAGDVGAVGLERARQAAEGPAPQRLDVPRRHDARAREGVGVARGGAARGARGAQRKGPTGGWVERARRAPRAATGPLANLESSDALDVDDVPDLADRADDVLELEEVGDLDHEVVDAPAVVGDRDLGLGDVAVA